MNRSVPCAASSPPASTAGSSAQNAFGTVGGVPEHIHPAVGQLGLLYSNHRIVGGNARCASLLRVLQGVIRDYQTPPNLSLHRHLEVYLRPQINHLVRCRPLSVGMGHAIRHLKWEIGHLDPGFSEQEAKDHLCSAIDTYVRERIEYADRLIVQHCGSKISDGDLVLIYAHSEVVLDAIVEASSGRRFSLVVVDSTEGEGMKALQRILGSPPRHDRFEEITYIHIASLGHLLSMKKVDRIFLGAHCVYSNGNVLSRAGSSLVAMMGYEYQVPVLVCCETFKFSDKVQLDSFMSPELVETSISTAGAGKHGPAQMKILYDVTPSMYVSMIVTEIGMIPCTSVPVVLREYRPFPCD